MIQLVGIRSNCGIDVRQKFSIVPARLYASLKKVGEVLGSIVIVSTCNRTEVYVDSEVEGKKLIDILFECLGWDVGIVEYVFYTGQNGAVKHLFEVSCGFHSRILGEDQILGQIKDAYESAVKAQTAGGRLHKLFQCALSCGKEFKHTCKMYEIPVSVPSIAVKEAESKRCANYMIIGFGKIGKLILKYLNRTRAEKIYVVSRNPEKAALSLEGSSSGIKFVEFDDRKKFYSSIDCIFSCTSAPHEIISKGELPNSKIRIFDLAVPRDVSLEVKELSNICVYDIDSIGRIDGENKKKRRERMSSYRYIIDKYINEFDRWNTLLELSPEIQKIKMYGHSICEKRIKTYVNKRHTRNDELLARTLIESTARAYINRAIDVLKEEKLKGSERECIDIINRIFCRND